jgi:hypothetical protein
VSVLNSPIALIAPEVARSGMPAAVLLPWAALRPLPTDVQAAAVDSAAPRHVRADAGPPLRTGLGKALRLVASLLCLVLALCPAASVVTPAAAAAAPYAPSLHGKVVKFGLSGFEPDFDPIDRVIIAATLHDGRKGGLPDAMLVLSAYLENFQPDTTPVLPDLLHPDQTATSLGGFLTGKAALANAAGHVVYRGGLLAEVFLDNSVHLVLDLDDVGHPAAPPLRLRGVFTLRKDLTLRGGLRAAGRPVLPALAAPRAPAPSWQTIERGLSVPLPRMMGTAGRSQHAPQAARPTQGLRPGVTLRSVALGLALVLALGALALWFQPHLWPRRRWSRGKTRGTEYVGDAVEEGEAASSTHG